MEGLESSGQSTESTDKIAERLFHNRRRCYCFHLPCFDRNSSSSSPSTVDSTWWQKLRAREIGRSGSIWGRGVTVLKKIREWSEIVAGPRWKTFIRRFNRNRSGNKQGNFQYDPLSYAMNFDEGPGQNSHLNEEEVDGYYSRNFSSRYAKGSMDLGKDGPAFV